MALEQSFNKSHMFKDEMLWNSVSLELLEWKVGHNTYWQLVQVHSLSAVSKQSHGLYSNWQYLLLTQNKQHLLGLSKQWLSIRLAAQGS